MTSCKLSNLFPEGSLSLLTKYSDNAFRLWNFYILFHFLKSIIILLEIRDSAYIPAKAEICCFGCFFAALFRWQILKWCYMRYLFFSLLQMPKRFTSQMQCSTSLLSLKSRTYGTGNVMHYGKNVLRLWQSIVHGTARK